MRKKSEKFARILRHIVRFAPLEGEWLDLLSQLEYVGCRKIIRSQSFETIHSGILRHIAEEASHAFQLKALVDRFVGKRSWSEGLFSRTGWDYFQTLDRKVCALSAAKEPMYYPAVSWAIEQRVLRIYPEYLKATTQEDVKRVILRILVQERRHGSEFELTPFPTGFRAQVLEIEDELWKEFVDGLEEKIKDRYHFHEIAHPLDPAAC